MKNDDINKREPIDIRIGNTLIEVKAGVAALRNVRAGLLQLAYDLAKQPGSQGLLVLPDVSVTKDRLEHEYRLALTVLRPDVLNRITLLIGQEGRWIGIPKDPDPETRRIISEAVASQHPGGALRLPRPDYCFMIAELLIHQWLLGRGPMTTAWLMKTVGSTYQTAAKALRPLGEWLIRHSDRRIELRGFPAEEWARLVAISEKARGTIRFADRSGQPRSWESLTNRLKGLGRKDLAIGGVLGTKHYYPSLDLVGSPRLDISLHCPSETADLSFVEGVDPALIRTERREDPASFVVHLVRRADPLFERTEEGTTWADPVECLFDLHEARLEPQALEFLHSFPTARAHL